MYVWSALSNPALLTVQQSKKKVKSSFEIITLKDVYYYNSGICIMWGHPDLQLVTLKFTLHLGNWHGSSFTGRLSLEECGKLGSNEAECRILKWISTFVIEVWIRTLFRRYKINQHYEYFLLHMSWLIISVTMLTEIFVIIVSLFKPQ